MIHHLLKGDIGWRIHHLTPHDGNNLYYHKYNRSKHFIAVASVTSAAILPKITVSHCVDVVAVDMVPPAPCTTDYCSVSPADFPCTTSTWIHTFMNRNCLYIVSQDKCYILVLSTLCKRYHSYFLSDKSSK